MKRKMITTIIIFIMIITISKKSFGIIEIKPSAAANANGVLVNTTVSNSYLLCIGMTNNSESLAGTTVLPHLATNKDWGAVSYLSNSIYGTNTAGENSGIEITMDGIRYYSTNGNATGVMNWGKNPYATEYTQTAGLISSYNASTSAASVYVAELYNNRTSRYVDFIDSTVVNATNGMATRETTGMFSGINFHNSTNNDYPGSIRIGLFRGGFGTNGVGVYTSGARIQLCHIQACNMEQIMEMGGNGDGSHFHAGNGDGSLFHILLK